MGIILSKYKYKLLNNKHKLLTQSYTQIKPIEFCQICYKFVNKKNIRYSSELDVAKLCKRCFKEYKQYYDKQNLVKRKKKKSKPLLDK